MVLGCCYTMDLFIKIYMDFGSNNFNFSLIIYLMKDYYWKSSKIYVQYTDNYPMEGNWESQLVCFIVKRVKSVCLADWFCCCICEYTCWLKVHSTEEDIYNQEDRMTTLVETVTLFFNHLHHYIHIYFFLSLSLGCTSMENFSQSQDYPSLNFLWKFQKHSS